VWVGDTGGDGRLWVCGAWEGMGRIIVCGRGADLEVMMWVWGRVGLGVGAGMCMSVGISKSTGVGRETGGWCEYGQGYNVGVENFV